MTLPSFGVFLQELKSTCTEDLHRRERIIHMTWKEERWYDPGYMLSSVPDKIMEASSILFYNHLKDKYERQHSRV
mgnify:CR=1 FL=1